MQMEHDPVSSQNSQRKRPTCSFTLPRDLIAWVDDEAWRRRIDKSALVEQAIVRLKAETETEEAQAAA
jgi:hypothetical protein